MLPALVHRGRSVRERRKSVALAVDGGRVALVAVPTPWEPPCTSAASLRDHDRTVAAASACKIIEKETLLGAVSV